MFGLRREGKKALIESSAATAAQHGYGGQSKVAPMRRVLVRRPAPASGPEDSVRFGYPRPADDALARAEHEAFVDLLTGEGIEVIVADPGPPGNLDAIYVADPSFVTDEGVILLQPARETRQPEVALASATWRDLDVPVLGEVTAPGTVEGGDLLWIDSTTVAAGQGYRTNEQGIDQLEVFLRTVGVDLVVTHLPHWLGEGAGLHLLSLISPVAPRVAVAYMKLLPVPFVQELKLREWTFIEVPDEEFATQGSNVLALAPGKLLMLRGNPVTQQRLRDAGYEVLTYTGDEISLNRGGGPTCLTSPVLRDLAALVVANNVEDADA